MQTCLPNMSGTTNLLIKLLRIHSNMDGFYMLYAVKELFILDYLALVVHNTIQVLQKEREQHSVRVHMWHNPH